MTHAMQNFMKSPRVVIVSVLTIIIMILIIIQVLMGVQSQNFKIATRYSATDQLVVATGYWYYLYSYLLFALVSIGFCTTTVNRLIKQKRPNVAFAVLVVTALILALTLVISHVILGLSSGM